MEYPIETVNLTKRYPTSSGRSTRPHFHHRGVVTSFGGILNAIKGTKGPFIEALRGVSLKVKKGEVLGILGPNGAGKTTLIKILCTLVIHDEGEAYINGFNVRDETSKVLQVLQAVLPESRGFNWRLTGYQNLKFYSLLYGLKEKEANTRIQQLLEFTGLEERADDMYQRYSTGMQRKLLLCRALLRDTPILLFDEPTVGLDPGSAAEFRRLLHDILVKKEGKTIIASTHNLSEAQDMCDRIAILDRGKITACDTPENIRYKMFDERVLTIKFYDTVYLEQHEKMVDRIQSIQGVYGATNQLEKDGIYQGMYIRADKNLDLSRILSIIVENGLKIKSINTVEPTLEEAFIAITGKRPAEPPGMRGHGRWRFR